MEGECINVAGWASQVEYQHGNNATIASLIDELGRVIKRQKHIGESFQKHYWIS